MNNNVKDMKLELVDHPLDANRPNRICISLSDIHLTDGTVGFQNLGKNTWDAFYTGLSARCQRYDIKEVVVVLDGDIIDMVRTSKWAESGIYPWQRDRTEDFSHIVNEIVRDIVDVEHKDFFRWLRELPGNLKVDNQVDTVEIVVLLGNHDKEMLCDQKALSYFYEAGLGKKLSDISDKYRRAIGRMYGDEGMFADAATAPYLPFYYGDSGFRFFTTHGQWRDKDNSRKIKAANGFPGWSVKDGWQNERWQKLKFAPFLEPCFGDTVAAGVLSTFIYKTKKALEDRGHHDDRLMSILDELDLYRPTYKALTRLLEETKSMRKRKYDGEVTRIIEDALYVCIIDWLSWDFTYESSSWLRRVILKLSKITLKSMRVFKFGLEIKTIAALMKAFDLLVRFNPFHEEGGSVKEMAGFPAFLPAYRLYGFQIHSEGHTHIPLEEEPNFNFKKPSTYINLGTWRDQIVGRKNTGYRRRSVLRALYILDLADKTKGAEIGSRSFNYYTDDIVHWSDKSDMFSRKGRHQPHV
jgi:hypothetical protein